MLYTLPKVEVNIRFSLKSMLYFILVVVEWQSDIFTIWSHNTANVTLLRIFFFPPEKPHRFLNVICHWFEINPQEQIVLEVNIALYSTVPQTNAIYLYFHFQNVLFLWRGLFIKYFFLNLSLPLFTRHSSTGRSCWHTRNSRQWPFR